MKKKTRKEKKHTQRKVTHLNGRERKKNERIQKNFRINIECLNGKEGGLFYFYFENILWIYTLHFKSANSFVYVCLRIIIQSKQEFIYLVFVFDVGI